MLYGGSGASVLPTATKNGVRAWDAVTNGGQRVNSTVFAPQKFESIQARVELLSCVANPCSFPQVHFPRSNLPKFTRGKIAYIIPYMNNLVRNASILHVVTHFLEKRRYLQHPVNTSLGVMVFYRML